MAAVDDMIAEIEAFEPTDDSADNDERLQIWVDRWEETPEKEQAIAAMFGLFERYPDLTLLGDHGEPGPIVHAVEQIPGYEEELAKSLEKMPSYYGVWMVNRILESDRPPQEREAWLNVLRQIAQSETADPTVRQTAQEFLGFQGV